jgi:hypothetical protein
MYLQKVISRFGFESGSISQRHGSADPDLNQNVMDPEHCLVQEIYGSGHTDKKENKFASYIRKLRGHGCKVI